MTTLLSPSLRGRVVGEECKNLSHEFCKKFLPKGRNFLFMTNQETEKGLFDPNTIRAYVRLPEYSSELLECRLFRVGPKGEKIREVANPPKERGLVIGIGNNKRIVVVFPFSRTEAQGYHVVCTGHVSQVLGKDLVTILNGSIWPENKNSNAKSPHVISIYNMPPGDIAKIHGGTSSLEKWELGIIEPGSFITPPVAQSLMFALHASRLEIIYGRSSAAIYGLNPQADGGKPK